MEHGIKGGDNILEILRRFVAAGGQVTNDELLAALLRGWDKGDESLCECGHPKLLHHAKNGPCMLDLSCRCGVYRPKDDK